MANRQHLNQAVAALERDLAAGGGTEPPTEALPAAASVPSRPSPTHAASVLFAAWLGFTLLLVNRSVVFGSRAGGWVYRYVDEVSAHTLWIAAGSALAIAGWMRWSTRRIASRTTLVVASWVLLGFAFDMLTRGLYAVPIERIISSKLCTSFYSAAREFPAHTLLTHFEQLTAKLPLHARTNMPGKTLLFHALMQLSLDPKIIGILILALANLGGVLVFAVAARLLQSKSAALLALALYAFMPAKSNFLPVLNVISALFVLAPLWLLLVHLDRRSEWALGLLGISLYALLVFEPLPFALGPVFLGVLVRYALRRQLGWEALATIVAVTIAGFACAHFAMRTAFDFDAIAVFRTALADAVSFNQRAHRPYGVWVVQNLVEFFLAAGVFSSLVLWSGGFELGSRAAGAWRKLLAHPVGSLWMFLMLTIVVLDVLGVNRGEVTRLWIFLAVPLQIVVAGVWEERYGQGGAWLIVSANAVQAVISTATVGYLICR